MVRAFDQTSPRTSAAPISIPLRTAERPGHRKRFLAVCMVIVDAPRLGPFLPAPLYDVVERDPVDAVILTKPVVLRSDHRGDGNQRDVSSLDVGRVVAPRPYGGPSISVETGEPPRKSVQAPQTTMSSYSPAKTKPRRHGEGEAPPSHTTSHGASRRAGQAAASHKKRSS